MRDKAIKINRDVAKELKLDTKSQFRIFIDEEKKTETKLKQTRVLNPFDITARLATEEDPELQTKLEIEVGINSPVSLIADEFVNYLLEWTAIECGYDHDALQEKLKKVSWLNGEYVTLSAED